MSDHTVFWISLCCLVIGLSAASKECHADSSIWVTPGAVSYHLDRQQDNGKSWNETNYGLGVEYEVSTSHAVMAGVYRNSIDRWTHYVMYQWTPLSIGKHVRLGAMVGAVDGYESKHNVMPALAPVATIEGKHFGVNISFVPGVEDLKTASVFAVQFKVKLP